MTTEHVATIKKDDTGQYPAYAWPGGYPVYYVTADSGVLCPKCANEDGQQNNPDDPQWHIVGQDIHWEGQPIMCDNCYCDIDSAYGDPEQA